MKRIITALCFFLLLSSQAFSADVKEYLDGPTGVTVKFNDDGEMKSIVSTGEAEMHFGDAKDVRTAKQKATLRAKASIAKFINERISTEEVMDDLTKTSTEAASGGNASATRSTLETQREVIKNSADAMLKGLVTLATDVNHDKKNVTVVLGTNEKYMRAADKLKSQMEKNHNVEPTTKKATGKSGAKMPDDTFNSGTGRIIKESGAMKDF